MSFNLSGDSAACGGSIKIAKLNLANYVHWRIEMEQVLQMHGVWDVLHNPRPIVPPATLGVAQSDGAAVLADAGEQTGDRSATAVSGDAASSAAHAKKGKAPAAMAGRNQPPPATRQAAIDAQRKAEAVHELAVTAAQEWDRQKVQARGLIILALEPVHQVVGGRHSTAKGVWDALERDFRSRGMARAQVLRTLLDALKKSNTETVLEYVARARTIQWELKELGEEASDRTVLMTVLTGLPSDYHVTVGILEASDASFGDAMPKLITAEQGIAMLKARQSDPVKSTGVAFTATSNITCFGCRRRGHVQSHCRSSGSGGASRGQGRGAARGHGGPGRSGRQAGHSRGAVRNSAPRFPARDMERRSVRANPGGTNDDDLSDGTHALSAVAGERTIGSGLRAGAVTASAEVWVVDSGASHHMTGKLPMLREAERISPLRFHMANGDTRPATHSGKVLTHATTSTGTQPLVLTNVLVVPGLATNLFSVPRAARNGAHVAFTAEGVSLTAGGRELARGHSRSGVYVLDRQEAVAMTAQADDDSLKWHRRFGHAGGAAPARTPAAVDGMCADTANLPKVSGGSCMPCAVAKMTRLPFTQATDTPKRVMDLIHTDVCGHMPVESTGGSRYFVTVIDGYSHYAAVIALLSKDEAGAAVRNALLKWERATGHKVKRLRRDGGGEYTGHELSDWLRANGVDVQVTAPETPKQNGVAERYNRTLAERAVAMMEDAGLTKAMWAEAVGAANYTANRIPRTGETKIPFELFRGGKPTVANLREFGCRAVLLALKKGRRKLDPRGQAGVLVGYLPTSKAYRVRVGAKVVESRNVRVNEEEFPGLGEPTQPDIETDLEKVLAACRLVVGTGAAPSEPADKTAVAAATDDTTDDEEEGIPMGARATPDRMSEADARKEPDWPLFEEAARAKVD